MRFSDASLAAVYAIVRTAAEKTPIEIFEIPAM